MFLPLVDDIVNIIYIDIAVEIITSLPVLKLFNVNKIVIITPVKRDKEIIGDENIIKLLPYVAVKLLLGAIVITK